MSENKNAVRPKISHVLVEKLIGKENICGLTFAALVAALWGLLSRPVNPAELHRTGAASNLNRKGEKDDESFQERTGMVVRKICKIQRL